MSSGPVTLRPRRLLVTASKRSDPVAAAAAVQAQAATDPPNDTVWINLKVVAGVPPRHRINTQHVLFYHQPPTWWTSVCRTVQGARRTTCVQRIAALVDTALRALRRTRRGGGEPGGAAADAHAADSTAWETHLVGAARGIQRLRTTTYGTDATVGAALDRVVDKIRPWIADAAWVEGDCCDEGRREEDTGEGGTL